MYDVVIIGGGLSGLMASIWLADRGKKTALISKGDPMCCLSTGCIDVFRGTSSPLKGIERSPRGHPYHLVGLEGIRDSLNFFKKIMAGSGLNYIGDIETNRGILTPLGTIKATCLVPQTMEAAYTGADEYIHIVSFKGLKDFYPAYITSKNENAGYSVFDAGISTTIGLATRFEDTTFRREFVAKLKSWEIPNGRIALPAVLGLSSSVEIMEAISKELDRKIFEIPTLPPSIPGIRLFRRLKYTLQQKGGDIYWGRDIASVERSDTQIEAVTIVTGSRPTRVEGRAFVLATGSFVSGGLYALRESVYETVFNLPVIFPKKRAKWFNEDFFDIGHPIEKAGIRVDRSFRPRHANLENLFVCGSILAFSDIMKYRCGNGMAIATGVAAAKSLDGWLG